MTRYLLQSLFVFICFQTYSQADSLHNDIPIPNKMHKIMDKRGSFFLSGGFEININKHNESFMPFRIGYEQKLLNSVSLIPEVGIARHAHIYKNNVHFRVSARYYHNLQRRITTGKTGNNFLANYFYFTYNSDYVKWDGVIPTASWDFHQGKWKCESQIKIREHSTLQIGYGFQRQVYKRLIFNAEAGILKAFPFDSNVDLNIKINLRYSF